MLTLSANGQRLAGVADGALTVGYVGLAGESFSTSQAVIGFNAFVAARP
jgi:hypothetical protein